MTAPSPRAYRYLHYDVFTNVALTGNQLAVFTDPVGLTASDMARVTREMNFSECAFVFPPEQADTDVRLRIFNLVGEMLFAGHPAIGSAFALAHEGHVSRGRDSVMLGLGAGPTRIDLEWNGDELAFAWMTQRLPEFGPTLDRDRVASALGVEPARILDRPIQEVSCGSAFYFVPVDSRAAVDQCVLDSRAIDGLFRGAGLTRRGVFVFTTEAGDDDATVYSRMFGAVREDPATGGASGPLGCYLARYGLVQLDGRAQLVSRQGVKMGRPSRVHIRLVGTSDEITDVKVGGASVLVGDGRITKI